ncbi:retropepsin-like aspartic protease family protein [Vreelandella salicampi]|uniref:TIGR02281 family clan AA aspartic protease n=1 Tax=Vreelandella salicampi TaxID=1449798 RepID=A0A7Z0LJ58_9GAMM|nr:TIGR02281 family clan AA aspartic protease [Halomonas salicampi]NYS59883.1 TIGR02281 family clan AA aspartic protease [Halomonas salicampi]
MTQRDGSKRNRGSGLVMMLLFWVLLMAVGTWWLHGGLEATLRPNAHIAQSDSDGEPLTLKRNRAGHFQAPGSINGEPVTFLLDTGATYVAVPQNMADRLGLELGRSAWFNTANGRVEGNITQLDEVRLGGIRIENVQGSIGPGMERDTVLLGMSFLNLLSIEMSQGEMVLSLPEKCADQSC